MSNVVPIFDLKDHFDAEVEVGDKKLPVKIKRFSRMEMREFIKKWEAYFDDEKREAAKNLSPEAAAAREEDIRVFGEETIEQCITVESGYLRDRGVDVTNGAGVLEMFHARTDVLSKFVFAVYRENRLSSALAKNLNSPRGSESGSGPLIPTRGGDEQGPAAGSVVNSAIAKPEAVAESRVASPSGVSVEEKARAH